MQHPAVRPFPENHLLVRAAGSEDGAASGRYRQYGTVMPMQHVRRALAGADAEEHAFWPIVDAALVAADGQQAGLLVVGDAESRTVETAERLVEPRLCGVNRRKGRGLGRLLADRP